MTTIVIKKGIALTWPKATGLSILPLVGRSVSPFVAGGRQRSCRTQIQLAGPNPSLDPTAPLLFCWCSAPVVLCDVGNRKTRRGKVIRTSEKPAVCCLCFFEKAICFVGCYRPPTGLYHPRSLMLLLGASICLFICSFCFVLDVAVPFSSLRLRVAHYLPSW